MNRRQFVLGSGGLVAVIAGAGAIEYVRMGSLADYEAAQRAFRTGAREADPLSELVRLATLAPNGHNTQPWRFAMSPGQIAILPDFARRTPVVDPDDHHLWVSLGCAAETIDISANRFGMGGVLDFDAEQGGRLIYRPDTGRNAQPGLFEAIARRQSTRSVFSGRKARPDQLRMLAAAANIEGVAVALLTEPPAMRRLSELVVAGNTAQIANPAFVGELRQWLRFNPRAALAAGDGLFSASSGNPVLPSWLGPTLFDLTFKADSENAKYREQMESSAGVAVFAGEIADPEHWVRVGRACQRFALQATALGMKLAFVNQPVEEASLRGELSELAGMGARRPDLAIRFGFGAALPYAPRRPLTKVIVT